MEVDKALFDACRAAVIDPATGIIRDHIDVSAAAGSLSKAGYQLAALDRLAHGAEGDGVRALEWARRDAIILCEATEENVDQTNEFNRGRLYEAKHIRLAIAEAWRDEIQKLKDRSEEWSTDQNTNGAATVGSAAGNAPAPPAAPAVPQDDAVAEAMYDDERGRHSLEGTILRYACQPEEVKRLWRTRARAALAAIGATK